MHTTKNKNNYKDHAIFILHVFIGTTKSLKQWEPATTLSMLTEKSTVHTYKYELLFHYI